VSDKKAEEAMRELRAKGLPHHVVQGKSSKPPSKKK
jgi:hypothetical protein